MVKIKKGIAMDKCYLCPRNCGADREDTPGFCASFNKIKIARAALHMWEEGCISGKNGSGTVFFSGCNLRCVFCQNHEISYENNGKEVSVSELADIFLRLQSVNAHNINLVTPTHFTKEIIKALDIAKSKGLKIPVVYNCGGYEKEETIGSLKGYVDIFLPDFKYVSPVLSKKYSNAEDYFKVAAGALDKMYEIMGKPEFDDNGMMKKGIIVRHLLLPGCIKDSKKVLKYLYDTYKDNIFISIMSQYTPLPHVSKYPELNRKIYPAEYKRLVEYAMDLGITNGYIQEGDVAEESFIPSFRGEDII